MRQEQQQEKETQMYRGPSPPTCREGGKRARAAGVETEHSFNNGIVKKIVVFKL